MVLTSGWQLMTACRHQAGIEHDVDPRGLVVDDAERRDGAGLDAEQFAHQAGRAEREAAGAELVVQRLQVDARLLGRDHQKHRVLLVLEEQVLGVPAGNRAAQRLALLDGEQRRMRHGRCARCRGCRGRRTDRRASRALAVEFPEVTDRLSLRRAIVAIPDAFWHTGRARRPPSRRLFGCGCSSGVEHDLAKVGVEGSNPFARSNSSSRLFGLASNPGPPSRHSLRPTH